MVRLSKQQRKRSMSPRRPRLEGEKSGPQKDHLPLGFKEHQNSVETQAVRAFIPKIK